MTELQKAAKEGNKDGRETYFLASARPDERRLGRPAGGAVRLARGARGVHTGCVRGACCLDLAPARHSLLMQKRAGDLKVGVQSTAGGLEGAPLEGGMHPGC